MMPVFLLGQLGIHSVNGYIMAASLAQQAKTTTLFNASVSGDGVNIHEQRGVETAL